MTRPKIAWLVVLVLAVAAVASVGAVLLHRRASSVPDVVSASVARAGKPTYFCPMHPGMISDHPADCPVCQMRMVPRVDERGEEPGPAASARSRVSGAEARDREGGTRYRSTMNPSEVSDRPGKDSMGMEMVMVEVEQDLAQGGGPVPGLAQVKISGLKQQLIGVKTSLVTRAPLHRTVHAVGHVTADETRDKHVTSRVAGFVEMLYANTTGDFVNKGQPILEIFSPELVASQQEFLIALTTRERTQRSTVPSVADSGEQLVESVRRRLELFGLSDDQIRDLEASGRAMRTVTVTAPISGNLSHRAVTHGDKVEVGTHLMDLTDLSRVWVIASVYEYELPFVREGQAARVVLSYLPGKVFEGRISRVYPFLDPATRTAQVRVEVPNPQLDLKPDMYADVSLDADLGPRLAVPESAVLDTGPRQIVFVDRGGGTFEPREVTVGLRTEDRFEILRGLTEGERVLTSGNFFVDSESRLKAAQDSMAGPVPRPAAAP